MSYSIQYTQEKTKASVKKRKTGKKKWPIAVLVLALAIVARVVWPNIGAYAEKLLLLGADEQNEAAVTAFFQDVRSGDDFGDALTTFCREILKNAQS